MGKTVNYDLDGNMLSNGFLSCTYDSANRLVSAGGHTYTYNADDWWRRGKTLKPNCDHPQPKRRCLRRRRLFCEKTFTKQEFCAIMRVSLQGTSKNSPSIAKANKIWYNIGITGGCHGITVPFCGIRPQFWGFQPHKYMKFEAGMRFAALISFFRRWIAEFNAGN